MQQQLTPKDPLEIVPITFDFTAILSSITSITSVAITVRTGTDASASAMIEGAAQISGLTVIQLVKNGVVGNTYIVRADVVSGSEKYALSAILPVETA